MYCSFCGKGQTEIKKLIAGPGVNICDACVMVCKAILDRSNLDAEVFKPKGMTLAQFKVGQEFLTEAGRWLCTDKGKRTVVAKRVADGAGRRSLLAEAEMEVVFNEDRFLGCSPAPSKAVEKKPGKIVAKRTGTGQAGVRSQRR